jgi:hypothetical protein
VDLSLYWFLRLPSLHPPGKIILHSEHLSTPRKGKLRISSSNRRRSDDILVEAHLTNGRHHRGCVGNRKRYAEKSSV